MASKKTTTILLHVRGVKTADCDIKTSKRIDKTMKKTLFYVAVVLLIASFTVPFAASAFTAQVFDNPDYSSGQDGFVYKEKQTKVKGVSQSLFYGEYNATASDAKYEWVIHSVRNGSVTTKSTVTEIAENYTQTSGRKVIFATNGDYFDLNSGSNMESYVNNGIVVSKGSFATKHCIGFDNKGKVVVGRMTDVAAKLLVETADGQQHLFDINKYNSAPDDNEIAVYTDPGTYNADGSGKYVVGTTSTNLRQLPVWGTSRRLTQGQVTDDKSFTVKSNQFVVAVKGQNAQFFFDNVTYGVNISLVEIPQGNYSGCTWVLGGYDILVNDGVINTNCHTDNMGNVAAPRTFVGVKVDGTMFVCMLDGRQAGYALGITVNEEAQLASVLGARFALELDVGGSTTSVVLEGDKLTLTFDDLVLDVGTLSPRVSALSCVPLVLQNFPKVYLDSSGAEILGDVDTLRADFSLTLSGETLACSLWLDASGAPVYAEIAENDKIIAAAEFTNFIFGDILSPDAAQ